MIIDFCQNANTGLGLITHVQQNNYYNAISIREIKRLNPTININCIEYYKWLYWDDLMDKLDKGNRNDNIKYLVLSYIDRGVCSFNLLESKIKNIYPNIEELYMEQNFCCFIWSESVDLTTLESFFINSGLVRLRVGTSCLCNLFNNTTIIQNELDKIKDMEDTDDRSIDLCDVHEFSKVYEFNVFNDRLYKINIKLPS
jgi:hypothetical protein